MDFFFWTFVSAMWTGFDFFFFFLILQVNGTIGGWSTAEMYVFVSTFTLIDAFFWSFLYANMRVYTRQIFSGDFTHVLLKPIDAQYLVSVQDNSYTNVSRLIIGTAALLWSLHQLPYRVTIANAVLYLFFLCVSIFFLYCLYFLIATCAFWFEKLESISDMLPSSQRLWQVPRSIYTGAASVFFTVLLPLGLIVSVPSEILLGKNIWQIALYFLAFTCALFLIGRVFFLYSTRKYSSLGG